MKYALTLDTENGKPLSQDAKRIRIAEACGWKVILRPCDDDYHYQSTDNLERAKGDVTGYKWVEGFRECIPNYFTDLNAMHEAEMSCIYSNDKLPRKYTQQIKSAICREVGVTRAHMDFDMCITATAAQRAEAFGLTLNLWTA